MPYYIGPDDQQFLTTSGVLPPPDGFTEVTAEEYEQRLAAQRTIAEQKAADWWAEQEDEQAPAAL